MMRKGANVKSNTLNTIELFPAPFLFITIIILFLSLTGCASLRTSAKTVVPQDIGISEQLNVHLYSSLEEIREVYLYRGGYRSKAKTLRGFYSKKDNSIHCLKWDFYTCGHELFHVLQYKGDKTLLVENGYEHFKENNYASSGQ